MAFKMDSVIEAFVGVIIFVAIAVALIPFVLSSLTNLSTSGLVLASLFASVLPIVLAVAIFRKTMKGLQM